MTRKLATVQRETYDVVEKVCDKCGFTATYDDVVEWQEFQYFYYTGGYGAVMGDMVTYTADLCQRCYRDVMGPYLKREADQARDAHD